MRCELNRWNSKFECERAVARVNRYTARDGHCGLRTKEKLDAAVSSFGFFRHALWDLNGDSCQLSNLGLADDCPERAE